MNTSLSKITLVSMIAQLKRFLTFDLDALLGLQTKDKRRSTSDWAADLRIPTLFGEYGLRLTQEDFADSNGRSCYTPFKRAFLTDPQRRSQNLYGPIKNCTRAKISKGEVMAVTMTLSATTSISPCEHLLARALRQWRNL